MRKLIPISIRTACLSKKSFSKITTSIIACMIFMAVCAASSHAQGFGILKMKGAIPHRNPPTVYLPDTTIGVEVYVQKQISPSIVDQLKAGVERSLEARSRRFKPAANPETIITCTIADFNTVSSWETRTRSVYQATGTRTVDDQVVTDYGYVDFQYQALVVRGTMMVAYELKDSKTGLVIEAEKLPVTYDQEFENGIGAPDAEFVYLSLVRYTATIIAFRLAPQTDWSTVLLAKGKLKESSKLLRAGLWNQALDALNAIPQFKKGGDEAYRLYSIALAYEGLAFMTEDPATTVDYLQRAAANYRRATELKPKEDHFWEPRNRAEASLRSHRKLLEQAIRFKQEKDKRLGAQSGSESAKASQPEQSAKSATGAKPEKQQDPAAPAQDTPPLSQASTTAADELLTNQKIIEWVRSRVPEDYIIAAIKHSRASQFDLSASGRQQLMQAGVSKRIVKAMQSAQSPRRRGFSFKDFIKAAITLSPYWYWVIFF